MYLPMVEGRSVERAGVGLDEPGPGSGSGQSIDYCLVCHGHTHQRYSEGRSWSASIIKLYDHSYTSLYLYHASCFCNPGLEKSMGLSMDCPNGYGLLDTEQRGASGSKSVQSLP